MQASGRLLGVAMERAIAGTPQVTWREGRIVAETARPSDRMLMFLLWHLHPALFDSRDAANVRAYHLAASARNFGPAMEAITDTDVEADLIDIDDYRPHPPPEHLP